MFGAQPNTQNSGFVQQNNQHFGFGEDDTQNFGFGQETSQPFGNSNWGVTQASDFNAVDNQSPVKTKGEATTYIEEDAEERALIEAAQRDQQERMRKVREREDQEARDKRDRKQQAQKELNDWYTNK